MEKSWNSGKWQNHFPDLEKSWNLEIRPKSWNLKMHHGKIMEFGFLRFSHMLLLRFFRALHMEWVISILYRSWKKQRESWKIHGIPFLEMAGNPETLWGPLGVDH